MFDKRKLFVILLLLMVTVAGCGGSEDGPSMIGSYPSSGSPASQYDSLPNTAVIVYNSVLDLRVNSVSRTANKVIDLAHEYGGYVTLANIWYEDSADYATVIVSVPAFNHGALHNELVHLGDLENETITGEIQPSSYYGWDELVMSEITVHLSERSSFVKLGSGSSHTAATFRQAFDVVTTLFGFLLDLLIWLLVVAGPFIVIGWGVRKVWRRRHALFAKEEEK